ncbi:uncharacterized protein LOC119312540 isoform X2 [Triticum dicoccoides]|uniref:uncharacterized protein LOC119312540 isoform X2 n=1 Tax=Triticum dicoccoides TaxID=85692 RepID=UPI00188E9AC6|nr:uncharacterized protein LOC119312540 isoform X2 [Triticum dicoccoides]
MPLRRANWDARRRCRVRRCSTWLCSLRMCGPPSLKADVLAMVMGAACAVAPDGRRGGRETVAACDTVTAGRETASARKTEAERPLCAGVSSRGVERSCSPHIAKGWRPPSPIQLLISCGMYDILYYETLDIPLPEPQGLITLRVAFHQVTHNEVELSQSDAELSYFRSTITRYGRCTSQLRK